METRANYVAIGAFVVATIFAAFVFIYWMGSSADSAKRANVKVIFPGVVTGLSVGSQVLFNGIKVGDVGALDFDPKDPKVVIATIRVDPNAPLRKDVKATLGFQGLTGVAYVELSGGTSAAPPLIEPNSNDTPQLTAEKSAFADLLEGAQDIFKKADATLGTIDSVITGNRSEIDQTIRNVSKFSDALAQNSDGVKTFMSSVAATGEALTKLSGKLEGLVTQAEGVMAAIPPEKVTDIVDNAATITQKMASATNGLSKLVADAEKAAGNLQKFTFGLQDSLGKVDAIINAVKPGDVDKIVGGAASIAQVFSDKSADIDQLISSSSQTMANVEQFSTMLTKHEGDVSAFLSDVPQMSAAATHTLNDARKLLAAVEPDRVQNIVASVDQVTAGIAAKTNVIQLTVDDAHEAMQTVNRITTDFSAQMPSIDQAIDDVQKMAESFRKVGIEAQALVNKVGSMVEGDGGGFVAEATKAATSIRKVAEVLEQKITPIANGIERFTGRGSADFSAAMNQLSQTLAEISRTVRNLNQNPSRVIYGGSDMPVFEGAKRR